MRRMVTLKIILPLVWTLGIAFCRPSSMSSSNAAILPGGSVAGKSDAAYNEFVNSDRSDHRAAIALSRFQQVKENLKKRGISANSIKALSYVDANFSDSSSPRCLQEFKFTLAAIKPSEHMLHARLQLRVVAGGDSSSTRRYSIKIGTKVHNGSLYKAYLVKTVSLSKSRYLETDVTDFLRPLVSAESEVIFSIETREVKLSASSTENLKCSEEQFPFVTSSAHPSSVPLLVVFSNDRHLMEINYEALEKILSPEHLLSGTASREQDARLHHQRKRTTTSCSLHSLVIPTSAISPAIIGQSSSFVIVAPSTFDAGICGGVCHFNFPRSNIRHTLMLSLKLRLNNTSHNYSISQCCLPAFYQPLVISGSEDGAALVDLTLENMRVSVCGCVDVAN